MFPRASLASVCACVHVCIRALCTVQCVSSAGVGANYSFIVTVEDGASQPSLDTLSYTRPVVSVVDGPGSTLAPSTGGSVLFLHGANFGRVDDRPYISAWSLHPVADWILFYAVNCSVVVDHVMIQCVTGDAAGTGLSWRVEVEGLSNALPLSTTAPPVIDTVAWANDSVQFANTEGGTLLDVTGTDFGPAVEFSSRGGGVGTVGVAGSAPLGGVIPSVFLWVLAGSQQLQTENCTMVVPHRRLRCVLPAGTGRITTVILEVLQQRTMFRPANLAYAPPELHRFAVCYC